MKKLHLALVFALTIMVGSAFGQKFAVGGATGINIFARNNAGITIPIVVDFEYAFKDNMSVATDLGYEIGARGSGLFYFSPEFRYHLNSAFNGFYAGGFLGVGSYGGGARIGGVRIGGGNYLGLGATLGYQIMVKENFNVDVNGQLGWGSAGGSGFRNHGFHLRPTVGLRYAF